MDTATHGVMGLGLIGLSQLDPTVTSDPATAAAVAIGIMLGSQAPDLDTLLRMKSNASYIKNHRGWSHSIPAVPIWTFLITATLVLAFGPAAWVTLAAWVLASVLLHVVSDLFNAYGTQFLRPFTDRWVAWNIIHIFDPVIFSLHGLAVLLWLAAGVDPLFIFPSMYVLLLMYYLWRTIVRIRLDGKLKKTDPHYAAGDRYVPIPTLHPYKWNIVKIKPNGSYSLGEWKYGHLVWQDELRQRHHPVVEHSKDHPYIAAFLYFSPLACPDWRKHTWGYEVRWVDVRFWHRKHYPFVGVLLLDEAMNPLDAYVGWLNDTRLEKKLGLDTR